MVNIIKEEISLEGLPKKKIKFICEFVKVKPTILLMAILEKMIKTKKKMITKLKCTESVK